MFTDGCINLIKLQVSYCDILVMEAAMQIKDNIICNEWLKETKRNISKSSGYKIMHCASTF